jgi:hypothetical protein
MQVMEAPAAALSTGAVLDRHLRAFSRFDVEGLLGDYAPGAVLFTPVGPLRSREEMRGLFLGLISEFSRPGATFTVLQLQVDGDHGYLIWAGETAQNSYEFATDTFVVREGKIVAQSFAAKITPKRETLEFPEGGEQR